MTGDAAGPETLAHEHVELRAAVVQAQEALSELELRGGKAVDAPPVEQGRWGSQARGDHARVRTYSTRNMRLIFDVFITTLEAHLDHEELVLPSLVERLESREADTDEVVATLRPLSHEHERLHELMGELRQVCLGIDPVRPAMEGLFSTFLRHSEEEDLIIFPLVARYAGAEVSWPVMGRYSDDVDLGRSLRQAALAAKETAEPASGGFFRRLFLRLGGRSG